MTPTLRTTLLASAAAVSLTVLAACGTTSAVAGASSGTVTSSSTAVGTTSGAMGSAAGMPMPSAPAGPHQQADVTFAQQMAVHHRGAIEMADLAPSRASSVQVKTLAAQIEAAQAPEIREMAGWLAAWAPSTDMNGMPNTTTASTGAMNGMGAMGSGAAGASATMPGMMTDAQMTQLTAATGAAFDKLFLQLMIVHHEGALTMAQTETAQGVNPQALALAKSITSSQSAQITQMKAMLAGM